MFSFRILFILNSHLSSTVNRMHGWEIHWNSLSTCTYVGAKFTQECGPSASPEYCIFTKSTNRNVWIDHWIVKLMVELSTRKLVRVYGRQEKIVRRTHEKINLSRNLSRKNCSSVRGLRLTVLHWFWHTYRPTCMWSEPEIAFFQDHSDPI